MGIPNCDEDIAQEMKTWEKHQCAIQRIAPTSITSSICLDHKDIFKCANKDLAINWVHKLLEGTKTRLYEGLWQETILANCVLVQVSVGIFEFISNIFWGWCAREEAISKVVLSSKKLAVAGTELDLGTDAKSACRRRSFLFRLFRARRLIQPEGRGGGGGGLR